MSLLLIFLPCATALVCPRLYNWSADEQPTVPGSTCEDAVFVTGECSQEEPMACLGPFLFRDNSVATPIKTSTRIRCRDLTCRGLAAVCRCDDAVLCTRHIVSTGSVVFLCMDDTDEKSRQRHKTEVIPLNYCGENNDITIDCTVPQDYAGYIILIGTTVAVVVLLFVYFCCKSRFFSRPDDVPV